MGVRVRVRVRVRVSPTVVPRAVAVSGATAVSATVDVVVAVLSGTAVVAGGVSRVGSGGKQISRQGPCTCRFPCPKP